jgi:hypothetical protein
MNTELQYEIPLNPWIKHSGNGTPPATPDTLVSVKLRNGVTHESPSIVGLYRWDTGTPGTINRSYDIVEYRIMRV